MNLMEVDVFRAYPFLKLHILLYKYVLMVYLARFGTNIFLNLKYASHRIFFLKLNKNQGYIGHFEKNIGYIFKNTFSHVYIVTLVLEGVSATL